MQNQGGQRDPGVPGYGSCDGGRMDVNEDDGNHALLSAVSDDGLLGDAGAMQMLSSVATTSSGSVHCKGKGKALGAGWFSWCPKSVHE